MKSNSKYLALKLDVDTIEYKQKRKPKPSEIKKILKWMSTDKKIMHLVAKEAQLVRDGNTNAASILAAQLSKAIKARLVASGHPKACATAIRQYITEDKAKSALPFRSKMRCFPE
ncbi:MAG: hypothetical protein AAGK98_03790 [Pseudomonadota bacterium]